MREIGKIEMKIRIVLFKNEINKTIIFSVFAFETLYLLILVSEARD